MLTDAKIRNSKPKDRRYRLADAHGLALEIMPNGRRYWRYRYRINGREYLYAGGEWCQAPAGETQEQIEARREAGRLTLAEARAARETWRVHVKTGVHPRQVRQESALVATRARADSFDTVAAEFIVQRGQEWSESHRKRFKRFLEADVSPHIGVLPVRKITAAHVLEILKRVEGRGAVSVAMLGRSYISQIFRYAVAALKAPADPTTALRGALQSREVKHHEPLSRTDIAPFMAALCTAGANRQTEIAIRLLMITMVRTVELRAAAWEEFDLDRSEWRIPATRMKMRRPHVVPLSTQAVAMLCELRDMSGKRRWLFPNVRRPIAFMGATTINRVIERMGYIDRFTAHGFRATASTMLHEAGFDSGLIERQLAHSERNKSKAAYDHSARLEERRALLQSWADMVTAMTQPDTNVVLIGRRVA